MRACVFFTGWSQKSILSAGWVHKIYQATKKSLGKIKIHYWQFCGEKQKELKDYIAAVSANFNSRVL